MTSGSRTRVDGSGGAKSFSRFLGSYTYNPADFNTLTNVVVTDKGTIYPEQGTVRVLTRPPLAPPDPNEDPEDRLVALFDRSDAKEDGPAR